LTPAILHLSLCWRHCKLVRCGTNRSMIAIVKMLSSTAGGPGETSGTSLHEEECAEGNMPPILIHFLVSSLVGYHAFADREHSKSAMFCNFADQGIWSVWPNSSTSPRHNLPVDDEANLLSYFCAQLLRWLGGSINLHIGSSCHCRISCAPRYLRGGTVCTQLHAIADAAIH
jgi:hypothetical protein